VTRAVHAAPPGSANVADSGALGYLYQDRSGTDGTTIQVLRGHKQSGDLSSAFGGTLTVVKGKKGGALKGTVQGLDLGALTGSVTVTLVVDGVEVSKSVAVKGSGNTRKFK
jgi:hypothetical protein